MEACTLQDEGEPFPLFSLLAMGSPDICSIGSSAEHSRKARVTNSHLGGRPLGTLAPSHRVCTPLSSDQPAPRGVPHNPTHPFSKQPWHSHHFPSRPPSGNTCLSPRAGIPSLNPKQRARLTQPVLAPAVRDASTGARWGPETPQSRLPRAPASQCSPSFSFPSRLESGDLCPSP